MSAAVLQAELADIQEIYLETRQSAASAHEPLDHSTALIRSVRASHLCADRSGRNPILTHCRRLKSLQHKGSGFSCATNGETPVIVRLAKKEAPDVSRIPVRNRQQIAISHGGTLWCGPRYMIPSRQGGPPMRKISNGVMIWVSLTRLLVMGLVGLAMIHLASRRQTIQIGCLVSVRMVSVLCLENLKLGQGHTTLSPPSWPS